MGLNDTPSSERVHIAFFGKRNAGKSSAVNAVTNQNLSVVSEVKGTTTDPVYKSMELLPVGPVMIIDTPGIDDEGSLGQLRINKAHEVLNKTDVAVLIVDSSSGLSDDDNMIINLFKDKRINYITVYSKADKLASIPEASDNEIYISSVTGLNIDALKNMIAAAAKKEESDKRIIGHLLCPEDIVILVVPVDSAAPKGRLILPQQQTIRDILDSNATAFVVQTPQLESALSSLSKKSRLIITDSQAFAEVSKIAPEDIDLTSFSILFANYKGILSPAVKGANSLSELKNGDKVLIAEGCTHHRQCNDIGTVKLPALIEKYTGVKPEYEFTSGGGFPSELSGYKMIIHCGGCMLNDREVQHRCQRAEKAGIPFTNYGVVISFMNGILKRTLKVFPDIYDLLK